MAQTSGIPDKWIICRICLQPSSSPMKNIFEEGIELCDQINLCSGLKLMNHQALPVKICSTCHLLLKASIKFRTLCHRSQKHLSCVLELDTTKKPNADDLSHNAVVKKEEHYTPDAPNNIDLPTLELDTAYCGRAVDVDYTVTDVFEETLAEPLDDYDECDDNDNVEYLPENLTDQSNAQDLTNTDEETEEESLPTANRLKVKRKSSQEMISKNHIQGELPTRNAKSAAYVCNICGNIYTERVKLTAHMKIHNDEKPHECEICHKRFRQTPQLARHMNSHTGNRPYKCSYCNARFADPSTCIKHQRIHTNERPYKCEMCNKAFSYSNVLKVHLKTHTGEKPYTCRYCERNFTQSHHKKAHERSHAIDPTTLIYTDEE